MKKMILKEKDILDFLVNDSSQAVTHEVKCIAKDCNGSVSFVLNQKMNGSVLICNKCKRGVVLKETKC